MADMDFKGKYISAAGHTIVDSGLLEAVLKLMPLDIQSPSQRGDYVGNVE